MNETLSFSDLFNQSLLNTSLQELTLGRLLLAMAVSLLLGLFLHLVYRRAFQGVIYSRSFGLSLVVITMITTILIMVGASNVVASLGIIGALSIVRFRTAVKEPMDLVFLFWAAAAGVATGAGTYVLALVGSAVIGLGMFLLTGGFPGGGVPYLLVVQTTGEEGDTRVQAVLREARQRYRLKSRAVADGGLEVTYELRLKEGASALVNQIAHLDGVQSAALIAYNGDYAA